MSFLSLQAGLDWMSKGHMLADVVAIIGESRNSRFTATRLIIIKLFSIIS